MRKWEQFPHAFSHCLLDVASLSPSPVVNHCIIFVFACHIHPIFTTSIFSFRQEALSVSGKTLPSLSISLTKHTSTRAILPIQPTSSERHCIFQFNINFMRQLQPSSHSYIDFRRGCHFTRPLYGSQILCTMTATLQLPYCRQTECVYICVQVLDLSHSLHTVQDTKLSNQIYWVGQYLPKYYVDISIDKILISSDKKMTIIDARTAKPWEKGVQGITVAECSPDRMTLSGENGSEKFKNSWTDYT